MHSLKSRIWILVIIVLFLIANYVLIFYKGIYWLEFLPLALLFVIVLFTRLDLLFYSIAFAVPLSLPLNWFMDMDFDVSLPSEIMIISLMMVFLAKAIMGGKYDRKILRHPVTIVIYFYLLWMFITCFTSEMPLVSFKYFLSRFWFICVFYFFGILIFKKIKNIQVYFWAYIGSFVIVILYTFSRHLKAGLSNQNASNWVCQPFYYDHTAYGAALAMVICFIAGSLFLQPKAGMILKATKWSIFMLVILAIVFSYTRATWISLIVAVGVGILMWLRIKFWKIFSVAAALLIVFLSFQTEIMHSLQKNRSSSSNDFGKHFQSVTNVTSDDSNLERLNRWRCALKMFQDRPYFGWGPGTYQFIYGSYQQANDMTIISTFAGDLGNAHSEYLGPLSEQGILGPLAFVLILITSLYTGIRLYAKAKSRKVRILAISIVLALTTYFAHGFLNNFLQFDKLSALFWGAIATLVAMDIYKKKMTEPMISEPSDEAYKNETENL